MALSFPPSPHQVMRAAQMLTCGAAAFSSVNVARTDHVRGSLRAVLPVLAFFLAAFVTRMILQETESRLQIAAFALATGFHERTRARAAGTPFSLLRWGASTVASTAGVLLAKHIVEPGSISEFMVHVVERVEGLWTGPSLDE